MAICQRIEKMLALYCKLYDREREPGTVETTLGKCFFTKK